MYFLTALTLCQRRLFWWHACYKLPLDFGKSAWWHQPFFWTAKTSWRHTNSASYIRQTLYWKKNPTKWKHTLTGHLNKMSSELVFFNLHLWSFSFFTSELTYPLFALVEPEQAISIQMKHEHFNINIRNIHRGIDLWFSPAPMWSLAWFSFNRTNAAKLCQLLSLFYLQFQALSDYQIHSCLFLILFHSGKF